MTAPEAGSRIPAGVLGSRTGLQLLTKSADVLVIDQLMLVFDRVFM